MDGKLIGEVLGYFSFPDERAGKVFVFPHIFAEVMQDYMATHGVSEADLAAIAVQEYANAKFNPCAQMNKVQITLDQALKIEGLQSLRGRRPAAEDIRLLANHRRLRGADPGDRRRAGKFGVTKSECVEIAGWGQATDPSARPGATSCTPPAPIVR